jgi:hypothetical protein
MRMRHAKAVLRPLANQSSALGGTRADANALVTGLEGCELLKQAKGFLQSMGVGNTHAHQCGQQVVYVLPQRLVGTECLGISLKDRVHNRAQASTDLRVDSKSVVVRIARQPRFRRRVR